MQDTSIFVPKTSFKVVISLAPNFQIEMTPFSETEITLSCPANVPPISFESIVCNYKYFLRFIISHIEMILLCVEGEPFLLLRY